MEKLDLRKMNNDELHIVRKQIVRLKEKGLMGKEIEELTGVNQQQISHIWQLYKRGGKSALKPQKSGRKKKSLMLLNPEQEQEIKQLLIDKTPDQVKLSFMLWTRQAVSDLVWLKYRIKMSLRVVTNYLSRWGFSCQRPTKRAYGQDSIRVKQFVEKDYPAIAKRAKDENAEIYWGDETGISNQENYQRGFAPKGRPPVMKYAVKRAKLNMLSAINNQGKVRFMLFPDSMTQQKLIEFMRRMIQDVKRKVFLILDNLKVHHGKLVKAWLEKHKERIELFFLPPYAPEYNPNEYLNNALKHDVHSGIKPQTVDEINSRTQSFMRRLQRDCHKVKAFFKHKNVLYAI